MKRRLITVILFAVAAALLASTVAYRAIAARTAPPRATGPLIAVAAKGLAVGALVQSSDVELIAWNGSVEPNWVLRAEDIIGRGVTANINRGEPFPENRLAPRGAGAGLAAIIPPGKRAAAVKVDEVVGVSGFVSPGMRVDILTSGTPPGQLGTITRTILQNIEVLSAGQSLDRDGQGKPSTVQVVNLLVTPQEAERLSLASGQMKVQLVLRNPLDVTTVQTAGISAAGLLIDAPAATAPHRRAVPTQAAPAVAPAVAHPEPKPVPVTVEVIHGSKKDAVVIGYTTPDKKEVAQ